MRKARKARAAVAHAWFVVKGGVDCPDARRDEFGGRMAGRVVEGWEADLYCTERRAGWCSRGRGWVFAVLAWEEVGEGSRFRAPCCCGGGGGDSEN